jgi:hypothetical protein
MESTLHHCGNCSEYFEGKFCNVCGQKMAKRITMARLMHELPHQIFHWDNQIFTTLKYLLTWPGTMVNDYILGKRKKYFPPITFLVFVLGFSYFMFSSIMRKGGAIHAPNAPTEQVLDISSAIISMIKSYWKFFVVGLIPIFALVSKLFFRKAKYNFAEHVFIQIFFVSSWIVVITLIIFIKFGIQKLFSTELQENLFAVGIVLYPIFFFYTIFYQQIKRRSALLLSILASATMYFIMVMSFAAIIGTFIVSKGLYGKEIEINLKEK